MTPATAPLTYLRPMRINKWFPSTPRPKRNSVRRSDLAKPLIRPSCHHQAGNKMKRPPMSRITEASTAENPLNASFCATIDPPQSTAAAAIAPYARPVDGGAMKGGYNRSAPPSSTIPRHLRTWDHLYRSPQRSSEIGSGIRSHCRRTRMSKDGGRGSGAQRTGICELGIPPCQNGIYREYGRVGRDTGRHDVRQELQVHVDEIEIQPLLPGLAAGTGIGRSLFGGVGPGQEPGPALQPVLMEIRGALDEQTHCLCVEPYFDIAADLHIRSERVCALEEGAGQSDFERDVRRHCPLNRPQVLLFQRRHRNEQQVGIGHLDVQHLIIVIAAEPPQFVPEGKRIAGFCIPDAHAGIQGIFRRTTDLKIEGQHEVPGAGTGGKERCA